MSVSMKDFILTCGKGLYFLTGGAGSGKTTLSEGLSKHGITVYSMDWRFIGDSDYRRHLLASKRIVSFDSYVDACNQFNWWNWNQIIEDCTKLMNGESLTFNSYDRNSTVPSYDITTLAPTDKILLEGAIPGPLQLINAFNRIFMLCTPVEERIMRLLKKDQGRRNPIEVIQRFLITEYSERAAYSSLNRCAGRKIRCVDGEGNILPGDFSPESTNVFLPISLFPGGIE